MTTIAALAVYALLGGVFWVTAMYLGVGRVIEPSFGYGLVHMYGVVMWPAALLMTAFVGVYRLGVWAERKGTAKVVEPTWGYRDNAK